MSIDFGGIAVAEFSLLLSLIFPIVLFGRFSAVEVHGNQRIRTIDGRRGIVSLFVVASHFQMHLLFKKTSIWKQEFPIYQNIGSIAVISFFMTTGFLFCKVATGDRRTDWFDFYIRRACRLYPVYLCLVALLVILALSDENLQADQSIPRIAYEVSTWLLFTLPGIADIDGFRDT